MSEAAVATEALAGSQRYVLVPIGDLHEHEATDPERLLAYEKELIERKWVAPIVADRDSLVILNGHHRYNVLKKLGCRRVPVYLVDYFTSWVHLDLWPNSHVFSITKRDVVKMGLGRGLFPPKTTRHTFRMELPRVKVDLSELM